MKREQHKRTRPAATGHRLLYRAMAAGLFLLCGALFADTLYFRDGRVIHGKIVGQDLRTVSILNADGRKTYAKTTIRRLTYGDVPDEAAIARQKREEAARRAAAQREAEERRQAEARRAKEEKERQAAEERKRKEEAERERLEKDRLKKEEAERLRKEEASRASEKAAAERKEEERKRQEEAQTKKTEAELRKEAAARRQEEEDRRRIQAEADQKKAVADKERRIREEHSRGIFVLSGGREVPGVVVRIEKDLLHLKTAAGIFILKRADIEKVRIQTKSGKKVITADKIRGEDETAEKGQQFSGRLIAKEQLSSENGQHYLDTGKGKVRLTDAEAEALGLKPAPPEGAEPKVGHYGRARLKGGDEVSGILVIRDPNEIVFRTSHGLIYLLTSDVAYMRAAEMPKDNSLIGRLKRMFGR